MDYKKTGALIARERKAMNMTQEQFAQKILVSAKTVSKWENGNGLPDTDLLIPICELFSLSLNELLSGERLSGEAYRQRAEDNITDLLSERKSNKQKMAFAAVCCFVTFSVMFINILLAGYIDMPIWLKACLIVYGALIALTGLLVAICYDLKVGSFECRHCGKRFIPKPSAYVFAPHGLTTRYLKCPHCGKRSHCKKRLTK